MNKRLRWSKAALHFLVFAGLAGSVTHAARAVDPFGQHEICTSRSGGASLGSTFLDQVAYRPPAREAAGPCNRPLPGSRVIEPVEARSVAGVLTLDLSLRNVRMEDGSVRYCYLTPSGAQSPTLRVRPGDLVVLGLTNELKSFDRPGAQTMHMAHGRQSDPCEAAAMSGVSTNLHFHGMTMPPVCHQDEVLKTSLQPGDGRFEYRFRVPKNEPPGLYWYHPHIHGFTTPQVIGGASGAILVEGIERVNPSVASLPERVLVIRDQDLLHPDAPPSKSEPVVPKMFIDRDGDAANNGTGFGKPAKDLSVNFVPVPYPDYVPARLELKPGERQLWHVLNASAITYLNLGLIFDRHPQPLGIVGIDGTPLHRPDPAAAGAVWTDHIGLPPGARADIIVTGPPIGVHALLVTRTVDTGQGGENDPNRALVSVVAEADAAEPPSALASSPVPLPATATPWLGDVTPVRVRKLYFSEKLTDPDDLNSATEFYLTVDGQAPTRFDPHADTPNIVVHQGDVEDWVIENRTTELHAFHIHQVHFLLMDWSGAPVDEPFLRDTVNVPYYGGRMLSYPSVRLRMDFRDPDAIGTFVYHCHLLEHEDGGMMGLVRVDPPLASAALR